MTKSYVLLALVGSVWLAGCDLNGVDGNGERVEQRRETASFSRIRSDTELDVKVTQADEPSVTVSIDSNLQDLVTTRVADDTLYLDLRDNIGETVDGPQIVIAVPELTAAKLAGAGSMTLAFDEPTLPLDLYLSGSGSIRFAGTTAVVGAYLSGSGDIRLEGDTSDVDMALSGSGSIRAERLSALSGSIDLSGSGDISASVQDSVTLSLSGSGQIDLYGDPHVDSYRNTGSGDIVRH